MARKIILISCTNKKLEEIAPAKEMYTPSPFFRKMRAYAERFGDKWFILSAKHHLLSPEEVIEPYNVFLGDFSKNERKDWAMEVLSELKNEVYRDDEIVLIAGRKYTEFLIKPLQSGGYKVSWPVEGMRFGEQMHWLEKAVNN